MLQTCQRFVVLSNWNSEAVLDRETGLVWEREPISTRSNWGISVDFCTTRGTGGRFGWRLPTIQELSSLTTPNSLGDPGLPSGHPFLLANTQNRFWSATTYATEPALAWNLDLAAGHLFASIKSTFTWDAWCVRGGGGLDGQ
jgi:hypothetical protein